MYKKDRHHQFGLTDFNQPIGLKMNPENRWVKKADLIPWDEIEDRYAGIFPSHTGMPAKPLRVALGSLIIQKQYGYSDRELVEQITENPYYQYFIGLHGYQQKAPYAPSLLVEFRKRLTDEILGEINEMIIRYNHPDGPGSGSGEAPKGEDKTADNSGTLILDATCAPQNIAYPQDIHLLNEARENLETIIDTVCYEYNEPKPRTYRRNARKDYLGLAKQRRRTSKAIRKAIKQQLQYVRRDLKIIDTFLEEGKELSTKDADRLAVVRKVYEQQLCMYEDHVHTVSDRIVSISQPYIRPIVRGKAKTPTEFGAKLDSIADLLFYTLVIIRLLPVLLRLLPTWIWYIVGGIVLVRLIAYLTAALKFHRFASLHTRMNKITGGAVFLLPYFLVLPCATVYCFFVVGVACISSLEELVIHITRKEYHSNMNALF